MTEFDLINTLSYNLKLINEFKLSENMFYSKKAKSIFERMKQDADKGLVLYDMTDYEINQIKGARMIPIQNMDGVKREIINTTKKKLFKDDIKKLDRFLDKRDLDFNLNETISDSTRGLAKRSTIGSDTKEVFKSDDSEFDTYKDKILNGEFSFVSKIKTDKWPCFDKGMRGLRPNKSTILSANTGIGKTAFSINLAVLVASCKEAKEMGYFSLIINLEMEVEELYHRILCSIAEVTLEEFEKASNDKEIKDKLIKAHEVFKTLNLYITTDKPKTVEECQYLIDQHNTKDELCLVIIDYLGKIKNREKEQQKEYQKLFEWVAYLNEMRKEKGNYHLWILSQLSREGEKSNNPSSRESISGAYAVLQDVDTVLTIIPTSDSFILKNEKNRGAMDNWMINFDFRKNIQRFDEVSWATKDDIGKNKDIESLGF